MTWRAQFAEVWPAPLAGLAALVLYARTLAPGLTWAHNGADGGDLLAAALTRGVPHPPGYPFYEILLQAVLALPLVGRNPAHGGNWLSALCAALAVALLADLIRRSLPASRARGTVALLAAVSWAASPTLWSQATITEVYPLNVLFVVAILWCAWRWGEAVRRGPGTASWPWLAVVGLLFGLGLGNHLSLALLLPGLVAWLWAHRCGLARLPRKAWGTVTLAFLVGLASYLYLPFASARSPAVNWGDPRTLDRFFWLVTARPYGGLVAGVTAQWLPGRVAAWVLEALRQFWPWGAALALLGLWQVDRHDHAWWRTTALVALACSLYGVTYNTADSYVYLIPVWAMVALWLAWGLSFLANWRSGAAVRVAVLFLALLLVPVALAGIRYSAQDLSHDHSAEDFIGESLRSARSGATILTATDGPTFALSYGIDGLRRRADLRVINVYLCAYTWYRHNLVARDPRLAAVWPGDGWPGWPAVLRGLAQLGPLYRAERLPLNAHGFREEPAGSGPLIELVPQ